MKTILNGKILQKKSDMNQTTIEICGIDIKLKGDKNSVDSLINHILKEYDIIPEWL